MGEKEREETAPPHCFQPQPGLHPVLLYFAESLSSPGKKWALILVLGQHSNLRDGFLACSPLPAGGSALTVPIPGQ